MRAFIVCVLLLVSYVAEANVVLNDIDHMVMNKNINEQKAQLAQLQKESATPLEKLADKYAMVVFFKSTCPHCARFEPIVSKYAKTKNFELYPYSVDGMSLPGQPNFLAAKPVVINAFYGNTQSGIEVPATFLVNKNNKDERYWVGIGEMSQAKLSRKIEQYADTLFGKGVHTNSLKDKDQFQASSKSCGIHTR